jgi:hypothetical protein
MDMTILIRDEAWTVPINIFRAVCSSWRQMSSRKLFWASIDICIEEELSNYRKAFLQDLLVRSGDVPLHLTLSYYSEDAPSLWHILSPHTRRMKDLRFERRDYVEPPTGGLELLYNSLPTLTALELCDGYAQQDERTIDAPNLRNVSYDVFRTSTSFALPWAQLSQLCLCVTNTAQLLQILSQCNSLRSLECKACKQETEQSLPCVSLTTLTTATFHLIHDIDYKSMSHCFAKLTLPSLTSLRIHARKEYIRFPFDNTEKWPSDAFSSFVDRSKCTITTLALEGLSLSRPILENVLGKLLALRHLKLMECKPRRLFGVDITIAVSPALLTDQFIEMLEANAPSESGARGSKTSPSGSDVKVEEEPPLRFVPLLESVEIAGFCSRDQFSLLKFLQMVRSRSAQREKEPRNETSQSAASSAGASLKRVTVCRWSTQVVESAESEEVERLEKMGVRIMVV